MRIVHYLNQFYGQIGGESEAYHPLVIKEEPVGPGNQLKIMLAEEAQIVATIICGDNYFNENTEAVSKQIERMLKTYDADLLIAGPAFNAGRYGVACGAVCEIAYEMGIQAVSGMYSGNPGVEMYRRYGYILSTADNARRMKGALESISSLVNKLIRKEPLGAPEEEGYLERGLRRNVYMEKNAAQRAVDMLMAKIKGEAFTTEREMPVFKKFAPSPAVKDMKHATIAVMTSGGLAPKGNPDRLEACNCTKYKKYSLEEDYGGKGVTNGQVVHGGYDPVYGNADGNRILPADALVKLEQEGAFGKLYDYTYVTVGNGTEVDRAAAFGDMIAEELKADGVDGVLLTST